MILQQLDELSLGYLSLEFAGSPCWTVNPAVSIVVNDKLVLRYDGLCLTPSSLASSQVLDVHALAISCLTICRTKKAFPGFCVSLSLRLALSDQRNLISGRSIPSVSLRLNPPK